MAALRVDVPVISNSDWMRDRNAGVVQIVEIRRLLHDLSNVLTGLLITAGLLRHFVPLTGNGGRYSCDIEGSAERAANLVSQVRVGVHRLQAISALSDGVGSRESTNVCDVRPSLGQKSGED